ncbi:uncharacterized protein LOC134664098 isoform X2 [Cydia fagiglandana]|uniref:uncharacterized protein LOC134664098 isoform X2 n=1 Tax=Cydia fagiglandana TaxID=1458189 RepID=UPI002FEE04CE
MHVSSRHAIISKYNGFSGASAISSPPPSPCRRSPARCSYSPPPRCSPSPMLLSRPRLAYVEENAKDLQWYCSATGRGNIAKQIVDVCNEYSGPIKYIFPPAKVQALGDTVLSPAYASCEKDPGCGPLSWNITQMCRIGPYRR